MPPASRAAACARRSPASRGAGRLHADQSRGRVRDRVATPAVAGHLSRHSRQLSAPGSICSGRSTPAGGVDALERAAPRRAAARVGEDLEAARSDLRLEITRAFWALVTARESKRCSRARSTPSNAHVQDVRSRLSSGLIPPNDVRRRRRRRRGSGCSRSRRRTQRGIAEADLRRLTGTSAGAAIAPAHAPAPDVAGRLASARVDALIAERSTARPERQALEQRAASAEGRARGGRAPAGVRRSRVGGGYDYARPNPRIFPRTGDWHDSWDASINAVVAAAGTAAVARRSSGEARANARRSGRASPTSIAR